ncbi:hypothetical protein V6N11_009531 [Hibiscus sabdariffa]|uniref:Uncharacterized protein n=1 Tax=Hibiscus sabdariffa TaxID=183260 RepID=A0ABR2P5N2_9ROSI
MYAHSPVHKAVAGKGHAELKRIFASLPRLWNPADIRKEANSLAEKADAISTMMLMVAAAECVGEAANVLGGCPAYKVEAIGRLKDLLSAHYKASTWLLSQRFQRSEYRFLSPSSKNYSRGTSSSHPLQARCKVRKPHGDTSKSNRFILLSVDKGTVPTLELIQSQLQQD